MSVESEDDDNLDAEASEAEVESESEADAEADAGPASAARGEPVEFHSSETHRKLRDQLDAEIQAFLAAGGFAPLFAPAYAEDYIHRIGRTGRATALGDAITFVSPDEEQNFRQIEKFIDRQFEFETCPGFDWAPPEMPRPKPVEKPSPLHRARRAGGGRRLRAGLRRRR